MGSRWRSRGTPPPSRPTNIWRNMSIYIPNRGKLDSLMRKCQIADANGFWFRNTITLKKLRKLNCFRDEIIEALKEEEDHLLNYIDKECKEKTANWKTPTKIQLGGWFYDLLYQPKSIILIPTILKVEIHPYSEDYSMDHESMDDDPFYETDNAAVSMR